MSNHEYDFVVDYLTVGLAPRLYLSCTWYGVLHQGTGKTGWHPPSCWLQRDSSSAIAIGVIATAATGGAAAPILIASLKIAATSVGLGGGINMQSQL